MSPGLSPLNLPPFSPNPSLVSNSLGLTGGRTPPLCYCSDMMLGHLGNSLYNPLGTGLDYQYLPPRPIVPPYTSPMIFR